MGSRALGKFFTGLAGPVQTFEKMQLRAGLQQDRDRTLAELDDVRTSKSQAFTREENRLNRVAQDEKAAEDREHDKNMQLDRLTHTEKLATASNAIRSSQISGSLVIDAERLSLAQNEDQRKQLKSDLENDLVAAKQTLASGQTPDGNQLSSPQRESLAEMIRLMDKDSVYITKVKEYDELGQITGESLRFIDRVTLQEIGGDSPKVGSTPSTDMSIFSDDVKTKMADIRARFKSGEIRSKDEAIRLLNEVTSGAVAPGADNTDLQSITKKIEAIDTEIERFKGKIPPRRRLDLIKKRGLLQRQLDAADGGL